MLKHIGNLLQDLLTLHGIITAYGFGDTMG